MSPKQPGYGAPACHGRRPRVRSRSSRQFPSPLASARRLSFELSHAFTHATRSILPFFLLFFGANAELSCSMANTQTRRKMSVGISLDAPLSKSECPSSSSPGHRSRVTQLCPDATPAFAAPTLSRFGNIPHILCRTFLAASALHTAARIEQRTGPQPEPQRSVPNSRGQRPPTALPIPKKIPSTSDSARIDRTPPPRVSSAEPPVRAFRGLSIQSPTRIAAPR